MKDEDNKFYASQTGIRELPPTGIHQARRKDFEDLLKVLIENLSCQKEENTLMGSVFIGPGKFFEKEVRFPKLKYVFNGCQAVLKITIITTPRLKRNILVAEHRFNCSAEEFSRNNEKTKKFFDNSPDFTDKIFNIIIKFCEEKEYLKAKLVKVYNYTTFLDFIPIRSEEERKKVEELLDRQAEEADKILDEMLKK
ncbi:MAG: hypothetical protein AAB890_03190 [Patescibacteria group bacterium]